MTNSSKDSVIIGGGFYGCCLAILLHKAGRKVTLLEREDDLLTRASYANQARVHFGYHYPRSVATGLSCTLNFPRFVMDFRSAVVGRFTKIYAIAKINSKVTPNQFYGYCRRIGAPIRQAGRSMRMLFDRDLIEDVFEVKEYAFDASRLRATLKRRLHRAGVPVHFRTDVNRVLQTGSGIGVETVDGRRFDARSVYNCSYARINSILKNSDLPTLPMKHEVAEIALVEPPPELTDIGVTVMDGPFFSTMPFPAESLHSLSHVRYTPHSAWTDADGQSSDHDHAERTDWATNFTPMVNDAARYLPVMVKTKHVRSLFETKTVLIQNESNDGRPILLRSDYGLEGLTVVMGGKIDNIYDVFQALAMMKAHSDLRRDFRDALSENSFHAPISSGNSRDVDKAA